MKKEGIGYKEASQYFYPASLPTTHHIPMLINDKKVIFSIDIPVNEKHVTLQIVENNLASGGSRLGIWGFIPSQ